MEEVINEGEVVTPETTEAVETYAPSGLAEDGTTYDSTSQQS